MKILGIRGFVFDAYGTLFDVNSAARQAQETLGDRWKELAELWRAKQLQYTWLRSLAGRHVDFWQLTGDALDFALDSLKLKDRKRLGEQLLDLYLRLSALVYGLRRSASCHPTVGTPIRPRPSGST